MNVDSFVVGSPIEENGKSLKFSSIGTSKFSVPTTPQVLGGERDFPVLSYASKKGLRWWVESENTILKGKVSDKFRDLATILTKTHLSISTDKGKYDGKPHLKHYRLSVGEILSRLYVLESIDAIVDYYSPDLTKEQVKEAIDYALDFLEMACEPQAQDNG